MCGPRNVVVVMACLQTHRPGMWIRVGTGTVAGCWHEIWPCAAAGLQRRGTGRRAGASASDSACYNKQYGMRCVLRIVPCSSIPSIVVQEQEQEQEQGGVGSAFAAQGLVCVRNWPPRASRRTRRLFCPRPAWRGRYEVRGKRSMRVLESPAPDQADMTTQPRDDGNSSFCRHSTAHSTHSHCVRTHSTTHSNRVSSASVRRPGRPCGTH